MRTRYLLGAKPLIMAAWTLGGLVGLSGCDSLTTGQLTDPEGSPQLVRIMFQDAIPRTGRGIASDYLDKNTGQACSDTNPCPTPQVCGERIGEALNDNKCHNPNAYDEVKPSIGWVQGGAVNQIRLVFNKVIDPSIEKVIHSRCSKALTPCTTNAECTAQMGDSCVILAPGSAVYELPAGTIRVIDPSIMDTTKQEVKAGRVYYDLSGSPLLTSDAVINPYGPAIVLRFSGFLEPKHMYQLQVNTAVLKGRKGEPLADNKGTPLPNPFTVNFVTEDLKVLEDWDCPTHNCVDMHGWGLHGINNPQTGYGEQEVASNEGFHFNFNHYVDETTADAVELTGTENLKNCTVAPAMTPCLAVMWERTDAEDCEGSYDDTTLDIVPIKAKDDPTRYALKTGTYMLKLAGIKGGSSGMVSARDLTVPVKVVTGEATIDSANMLVVVPATGGASECEEPPPPPDMTMAPTGDMSMPSVDLSLPQADLLSSGGDM